MRVYQLLRRRMLGVCCLFLLGLVTITLNGVPREYHRNRELRPLVSEDSGRSKMASRIRTEPSMFLTSGGGMVSGTSISSAISYVGGKLRLLVAYSPNDILSKDSASLADDKAAEEYNADFDIVEDAIESYDSDLNYEEDDADNPNPVFRVGDFDYDMANATGVEAENETDVVTATDARSGRTNISGDARRNSSQNGGVVISDGIFWSKELEKSYPKGMSDAEVLSFLRSTKNGRVARVEAPTWNRCGRPKNQFVVFEDGIRACARYRSPHHYLVQGEVMSFYLSRLLGISVIPPVTLSSVDAGRQWTSPNVVRSLDEAGWERNATVALIQWIDGLERDKMPKLILKALGQKKTIRPMSEELRDLSTNQLVELMQWSDLILFDYITGNYDRVASMQDAADREKKPSILSETIHNLVRSKKTKTVWLIDNESGLLDAYSLLYGTQNGGAPNDWNSANRFVQFHKAMLNTVCVFRRSTVQRINWLAQKTRPARTLLDFLVKREPLFKKLPDVTKSAHFIANFKKRLVEVRNYVTRCQNNVT